LRAIKENFDPHYDFVMIPKVPLDTLDFTSYKMNLGSKMIVDATVKSMGEGRGAKGEGERISRVLAQLSKEYPAIREVRVYDDTLLLVKVGSEGRKTVEKLVRVPELNGLKIIAAVSEDVDLGNQESYIWGVFTRFDCERDVVFTEQSLIGISPIYRGVMGIDATWKTGYPAPLVMSEEICEKVNRRWEAYWR
jgi:4-hydroxy-3-polyprenylbenzoate decarboxylase